MITFSKNGKSISLPTPDCIEEKILHRIQAKDLESEAAFEKLTQLLFTYPEREIQLFLESKLKTNNFIIQELQKHGVLCDTTEYYYYKHPKDENCFLKISGNKFDFEWQKDVVEKGPMFGRLILKLSERKKREFEIQQLLVKKQDTDNNPVELKPNFFGIGIDLFKFVKFIKQKWFR